VKKKNSRGTLPEVPCWKRNNRGRDPVERKTTEGETLLKKKKPVEKEKQQRERPCWKKNNSRRDPVEKEYLFPHLITHWVPTLGLPLHLLTEPAPCELVPSWSLTLHFLPFELTVPPSRWTCVDSLLTQHISTYIPHTILTYIHTSGVGSPGVNAREDRL
jgi:hypothetical protein